MELGLFLLTDTGSINGYVNADRLRCVKWRASRVLPSAKNYMYSNAGVQLDDNSHAMCIRNVGCPAGCRCCCAEDILNENTVEQTAALTACHFDVLARSSGCRCR